MTYYFTLTNNCNLECVHCCYDAGPGKKTIALDDAKKVIDNMSKSWEGDDYPIMLSGGEVFTRKELLYQVLAYIQETRNPPGITVQTNAFWATSDAVVEETLEELIDLGVTSIDISPNSPFHFNSGLNKENLERLANLAGKLNCSWRLIIPVEPSVFPIGRGRSFPKKRWSANNTFECLDIKDYNLSIDYDGNVYPCCFMVPGTEMGDAKDKKIRTIYRGAAKTPVFKALTSGGIEKDFKKLVINNGMSSKEANRHLRYGSCNLCIEAFGQGLLSLR